MKNINNRKKITYRKNLNEIPYSGNAANISEHFLSVLFVVESSFNPIIISLVFNIK